MDRTTGNGSVLFQTAQAHVDPGEFQLESQQKLLCNAGINGAWNSSFFA
jgi:hypothetical protein